MTKNKYQVKDRVRFVSHGPMFGRVGTVMFVRKDGHLIVHFDEHPEGSAVFVNLTDVAPERHSAAGSTAPLKKSTAQIKREVDEILARKSKGRPSAAVLAPRPERQLLLWIPFATKGSISVAKPVPVDFTTKEVESVWTLISSRNPLIPPVLPLHPVHGRGAFLEDYMHDWTIRGGNFIYRSRITDQPTWVLVQLK